MHNEKFQDTIHATGLEEIVRDSPATSSSSVNQPSGANNVIVVPPHR